METHTIDRFGVLLKINFNSFGFKFLAFKAIRKILFLFHCLYLSELVSAIYAIKYRA